MKVAGKGRVLLFAFGTESSGIPRRWEATPATPGVNLLPDLSAATVRGIAGRVRALRRPGDLVIASIHWGGNWGYGVTREEIAFAHALIDTAGIDLVHGHSSHHVKGIEVYRGKPILYGCGDLIDDYEGIGGYEEFRGELGLAYFVRMDAATGRLLSLRMVPTRLRRFRLHRATPTEAKWLEGTLNREGKRFGTRVVPAADGTLELRWREAAPPG